MTRSLRTIYVKREDPDSRMKAAEEICRRASSGGEWARVLLFPEGRRANHTHTISMRTVAMPFHFQNHTPCYTPKDSGWPGPLLL